MGLEQFWHGLHFSAVRLRRFTYRESSTNGAEFAISRFLPGVQNKKKLSQALMDCHYPADE